MANNLRNALKAFLREFRTSVAEKITTQIPQIKTFASLYPPKN